MAENSVNKDQEKFTSEKPVREDSTWLNWIKKKSMAMNKRFGRTNPDFLKNLKKRKKK
jgi:hypothetical protein